MSSQETIKTLYEMGNDLNILPDSKQGQAIKRAVEALNKEIEYEEFLKNEDILFQEIING